MQIDIDFDVFKALTAKRQSEGDSFNAVLRRLLNLPKQGAVNALASGEPRTKVDKIAAGEPLNALEAFASQHIRSGTQSNALLGNGALFDGIFFPEGTQFMAKYKGQSYLAEIRDGCWIGGDGIVRTSPSAAAGAISNTNVNGWRFWYCKSAKDSDWVRLDELKR